MIARLLLLTLLLVPLVASADSRDQQYIAGLRQRRLFELAETYCQQRLAAANLDDVNRADLTIELVRTYALHALHQPPAEREAWFKRAHYLAAEYVRTKPTRAVLI